MEIQQSYLEIFDSDGDRGSKDDDGKDAREDQINYQAFCFNQELHDGHFFILMISLKLYYQMQPIKAVGRCEKMNTPKVQNSSFLDALASLDLKLSLSQ